MNALTKNIKQQQLEKAKEYALSRGGECLSTEYINAKTKMLWKCNNDEHEAWLSTYDNTVISNHWCKQCAYDKSLDKDFDILAEEYAKSKGGYAILPEDRKVKTATLIKWKCEIKEHKEWIANYRNVVQKQSWCPYCAGRFSKKEYLEKAYEYANNINEICLSTHYENQNTKLEMKCNNSNHPIWTSTYSRLLEYNRVCPKCAKENENKKYLEKAQQHATSRNGKCLSTIYQSSDEKLIWQCEHQHIWSAKYSNVVGILQRWCPECAGQLEPEEWIKKAHEYANNRGGKFLSTEFTNTNNHYLWKCHQPSHAVWSASMGNIFNQNTWCPECGNSIYYKENKTRKILECLLDIELKKAKPTWNINPNTNHYLELDGYNKENKIAFEFQGRHHHEENVFKTTVLNKVQEKDKIKKENCIKNDITLIIINDQKRIRNDIQLINHILEELKEQKIKYKKDISVEELLDKLKVYDLSSQDNLQRAKEYALRRGGQCLSESYINYKAHLEWKCDNEKHSSWFAGFGIVNGNNWCPECAGKKKRI